MAAGTPASSPSRNPSGAAAAKQEASRKPGFQPSAAAHSAASATSSGRMVRTRNESSSFRSARKSINGIFLSYGRRSKNAFAQRSDFALHGGPAHMALANSAASVI